MGHLSQEYPPAPRDRSLDHGFPENFGYGLVPRVGGVNFQGIGTVALDEELSGLVPNGAVKIGNPDAASPAHRLGSSIDLCNDIIHNAVESADDSIHILGNGQGNGVKVPNVDLHIRNTGA